MSALIVKARWVVTGIKDRHTPVVIENGTVLSENGVITASGTLKAMQALTPDAAGWMSGGYDTIHAGASKVLDAYRTIGMRGSYCYAVREQNRLVYEADEAFCARLPADLGANLGAYLKSQYLAFDDFLKLFDQLTDENRGQRLTRIQLAPANLH